ncbi:MAG: SDR family oxidoreductase [Acidimicrobiia bacterium]|nr:SDR family oxidoreductase [Acidimicrobiia bacterium]
MSRVVVSGGAGFLGSHMCDRLIDRGDEVVVVDNLVTGSAANVEHLVGHERFSFVEHDVSKGVHVDGPVDRVMHLASPASPVDFDRMPIEILTVGSRGTQNMLDLALENNARFFLASTSEVYGDPLVHPQPETYWGNVNPIGPRAVYDEAKRYAEAITMAYHRTYDLEVRIVRIFNTYGPRMRPDDGRVVSNFITQALRGDPITVYGDGSQTRSFCYVDDQVTGQLALLDSDYTGPFNIGSQYEFTMLELAEIVIEATNSSSEITFKPRPQDDPTRRNPDLSEATAKLSWKAEVDLATGVGRTVQYFARLLQI